MKKNLLLIFFIVGYFTSGFAQEEQKELTYRRSSLTLVIADSEELPSRRQIMNSWNSFSFPDKYNKHDIGINSINVDMIALSDKELLDAGYLDTLKNSLQLLKAQYKNVKYLNYEKSKAVILPSDEELFKLKIDKYIKENKIAKKIIATWYNRTPDGKMDWELIKKRGRNSASKKILDDSKSDLLGGEKRLRDWKLISNTYIVIYKMNFFPMERLARFQKNVEKTTGIKLIVDGLFNSIVSKSMRKKMIEFDSIQYEKSKEGYFVNCTAYLYQLDWNDDTLKKFHDTFFNLQVDEASKTKAWNESSFKLNFVGDITSRSLVTSKFGESYLVKRTEEQIIDLQMKRTMDNSLAKLQKEYVQFRPVTPIHSVEPITAQIGLKEGLERGQTFEILMSDFDEFGVPTYKQIGKVKVDKELPIWDNREGAALEPELDKDGNPTVTPEFTTFKGGTDKAEPNFNFIRLLK